MRPKLTLKVAVNLEIRGILVILTFLADIVVRDFAWESILNRFATVNIEILTVIETRVGQKSLFYDLFGIFYYSP